jgi:hypothetical protein
MVCNMEKHYVFKSLKASNLSTQRCVFHRATYKDVGMVLNLNRLIVFAPPCISFRPYHGPRVDSAPSENEYQEHSWG